MNARILINNAPVANADYYRLFIGIPELKYGYETIIDTGITSGWIREVAVNVSSFSAAQTVERQGEDVSVEPSFCGRIVDQSQQPIKDCVIKLKTKDPDNSDHMWAWNNARTVSETRTNYNGYFAFYDVAVDSYAFDIGKRGYEGRFISRGNEGFFPGRERWIAEGGNVNITLPPALGRIKGYVYLWTAGGLFPVPEANVNIWGDWGTWPVLSGTMPTSRGGASGPAGGFNNYYSTGMFRSANGNANVRTGSDGSFVIEGLAAGNYTMNIWSQFSSNQGYNFNADSTANNSSGSGSHAPGERRITVSTFTVSSADGDYWAANIARGDGAFVNQDAYASPLVVVISTAAARPGRITGTLTFDVQDSSFTIASSSGIVVWAYEQNNNGENQKRFFTVIQGTILGKTTDYCIEVATNTKYWVQARSRHWGIVNRMENGADLRERDTVSGLDMKLAPAGCVRGIVKLPDGSIFKKKWNNAYEDWIQLEASGINTNCGEGTNVNEDGIFEITGLIPGSYNISVEGVRYMHNGGSYLPLEWPGTTVRGVSVRTGQETYLEVQLANGAIVIPQTPALPEISSFTVSGIEHYTVYGIVQLPSGRDVTRDTFSQLIKGKESFSQTVPFTYDEASQSSPWGQRRVLPGRYDYLLARIDRFSPGDDNMLPSDHFSMNFISQLKNTDIKLDPLKPNTTTYLQFESGTLGRSVFRGQVRGVNLFTRKDVDLIAAAGMEKFMTYIPSLTLYDAEGQMKAFGMALPPPARIMAPDGWDGKINANAFTLPWLSNELTAYPLQYRIDRLPAGDYVAVFETPNYPPLMKKMKLVAGDNELLVNFDDNIIAGSSLQGVVKSTDGAPIYGAAVVLTHRTVNKTITTDESGRFAVSGLPTGVYRMTVTKPGYAQACEKFGLGLDAKVFDNGSGILLRRSDCSIRGTIYSQTMPVAKVISGARVVAYDETYNTQNPDKMLPVITCITDDEGTYVLEGMISSQKYKVYVLAPGRLLEWKTMGTAQNPLAAGDNAGVDFVLKTLPPRLKVSMSKIYENGRFLYKFLIESPKKIINPRNPAAIAAPYCQYSPVDSASSAFDASSAIEVLPNVGPEITGTDGVKTYSYSLKIPVIQDSEFYKLRVEATDGSSDYTEDILFGPKIDAKAKRDLKDELAQGGDVTLDETGYDTTRITVDPGSITPANAETTNLREDDVDIPIGGFLSAMPNFNLSRTGSSMSSALSRISQDVLASDVYELSLGDAQLNRSLSLNLKFDMARVNSSDLANMGVYQYNSATGLWEPVRGAVTVDPVSSLVAVEVDSLAGSSGSSSAPGKGKAVVKNGVFAVNRAAATTQTGVYAVFKQDPNTAKTYAGGRFEIFNFPNPFNLRSKNVTMQDANASFNQMINGTLLKYSLPADKGGRVRFYIYNLAGELVKDIDEGAKTGGYYYYTEWDGRNNSGEECASGVYFLIAKSDGNKLNDKPYKLAILK